MKKIVYIIFLMVCLLMAVLSRPIITVTDNHINLGDLPQETEKPFYITVKNSGITELLITNIHTPCGCTKTFLGSDHIPAGGETRITIVFNTGKYLGKVEKYIEIISNDRDIPYYKVFFEVNVYEEFTADPAACNFGYVIRRSGKKMNISIKHKNEREFGMEGIECNKDIFDVSWKPVHSDNSFMYNVMLMIKPGVKAEHLDDKIRFLFKMETAKQFTLSVSAEIGDNDLLFEPNLARFTNQAKEVQVALKNHSEIPFNLKKIIKNNGNFEVTYTKVSENEYELNFLLTSTKENFFDTITVVTDFPEEKEKILRIVY